MSAVNNRRSFENMCVICSEQLISDDFSENQQVVECLHREGDPYRLHVIHSKCYEEACKAFDESDDSEHIYNPDNACALDGALIYKAIYVNRWALAERVIDFGDLNSRQSGLYLKGRLLQHLQSIFLAADYPSAEAYFRRAGRFPIELEALQKHEDDSSTEVLPQTVERTCTLCDEELISPFPQSSDALVKFLHTGNAVNHFVHSRCFKAVSKQGNLSADMCPVDNAPIQEKRVVNPWIFAELETDFGDENTLQWGLYHKGCLLLTKNLPNTCPEEYPPAFQFFQEAGGLVDAKIALGDCYCNGIGGAVEDFAQAAKCYFEAAKLEQGKSQKGISRLGMMRFNDQGLAWVRLFYGDCLRAGLVAQNEDERAPEEEYAEAFAASSHDEPSLQPMIMQRLEDMAKTEKSIAAWCTLADCYAKIGDRAKELECYGLAAELDCGSDMGLDLLVEQGYEGLQDVIDLLIKLGDLNHSQAGGGAEFLPQHFTRAVRCYLAGVHQGNALALAKLKEMVTNVSGKATFELEALEKDDPELYTEYYVGSMVRFVVECVFQSAQQGDAVKLSMLKAFAKNGQTLAIERLEEYEKTHEADAAPESRKRPLEDDDASLDPNKRHRPNDE